MISVLIPSKNRPKEFKRFIESLLNTADKPESIEIILYLDESENLNYENHPQVRTVRGDLKVLSQMYNFCATSAKGDIWFLAADDIKCWTTSWDSSIISIYEQSFDPFRVIHGNDLSPNAQNFGTHFFIHRHWFETLGYIFPKNENIFASDLWMTNLAKIINKDVYLPTIVLEHLHPSWGKAPLDSVYLAKMAREHKHTKASKIDYSDVSLYTEAIISLKRSPNWIESIDSSPNLSSNFADVRFETSFWHRATNFLRWRYISLRIYSYKKSRRKSI